MDSQHHVPPSPAAAASPNRWLLLIVAVAVIGGGSFYGGMAFQKSRSGSTTATSMAASGSFGGGTSGFAGRAAGRSGGFGTVTAISSSSISIADQAGTAKTYSISRSTTVTDNGSASSVGAIKTGDTVLVQTGSSTSTAATRISLNPAMNGAPGSGLAPPGGAMTTGQPAPATAST